jgi:hypothetical protein
MTDNKDDDGIERGTNAGQEPGQAPEPGSGSRRGRMRYQDAENTTPREPTLAEKRAMRRAVEQEGQEQQAAVAVAERKSLTRRRVLIGAGVTVGLVATVAVWYAAVTPDEVTANCVDDGNALSDENICSEDYVRSQGGYSSGGFFFIPLGGGGYRQYHYNYGGTVNNGRVVGGTTAAPSSGTTIKSTSGKTVQRGGFGVSGNGKSGGSSGGGGTKSGGS